MNKNFTFAFLWAVIMLFIMCTSNARAFVFHQVLNYEIDWSPSFSELLILHDVEINDSFYLFQKAGHVISFAIFYMLVLNWLNKPYKAFVLCTAFALFSEVLQLFFQRNGRFLDIGIDMIGIFLAYCVCVGIQKYKKAAVE